MRPVASAFVLAIFATGCGENTTPLTGGQIVLTSGQLTNRSSGFEHFEEVEVQVTDVNGPVSGAAMTWTPNVASDSVRGGEVTDGNGRARATWYFGPGVGDHVVTVSTPRVEPITFGIDVLGFDPADLHVGLSFACGRDLSGEVWCFGKAAVGSEKSGVPLKVANAWRFNYLDVETYRACGSTQTSTMVCWNSDAIFGGDPPAEISGFPLTLEVAALTENVCGLTETGTPWCGGVDYPSGPVAITGAPPLERLVGGDDSFGGWVACGLSQADGTAWCWGSNAHSSIGNGTIDPSYTEAHQVSGAVAYTAIAASQSSVCAIQADQHVACWGYGPAMPGTPAQNYAVPHVFADLATDISGGWFGYFAMSPAGPQLYGGYFDDSDAEATIASLPGLELVAVGDVICVKQDELEASCSTGLTDDILFEAWQRLLPLVTVPNPNLLP